MDVLLDLGQVSTYMLQQSKTWGDNRIRIDSLYIVSLRINAERHSIAQPRGEAMLTFFPANTPFLVGACTGVLIIWLLLENRLPLRGLHQLDSFLSRCTLSILSQLPGIGRGSSVVLGCTSCDCVHVVWWPLSVFWRTRFPTYSLEYALRQMSRHEEERAP